MQAKQQKNEAVDRFK